MTIKKKKKVVQHYVDNEKFYLAMIDYKKECDKVEAKWNKKYLEKKNKLLAEGIKEKNISPKYLPEVPWPRVTEYIGECIYKIATRSNNAPNFCSYTYKDEMIADGYEDCILRIKSFDPYQASFRLYEKLPNDKRKLMVFGKSKSGANIIETKSPEAVSKLIKKHNGDNVTEEFLVETIGLNFYTEIDLDNWFLKVTRNPFAYFTQACYYASVRRIKKEKKQKTVKSEMIKNSGIINTMEANTQGGDTDTYDNTYLQFLLDNVDQDAKDEKQRKKQTRGRKPIKKTTKAYQAKMNQIEADNEAQKEREARLESERYTDEYITDSVPDSTKEYYDHIESDNDYE